MNHKKLGALEEQIEQLLTARRDVADRRRRLREKLGRDRQKLAYARRELSVSRSQQVVLEDTRSSRQLAADVAEMEGRLADLEAAEAELTANVEARTRLAERCRHYIAANKPRRPADDAENKRTAVSRDELMPGGGAPLALGKIPGGDPSTVPAEVRWGLRRR